MPFGIFIQEGGVEGEVQGGVEGEVEGYKAQSGQQSRWLGLFCFLEGPKWTTVTVIRSFLLPGRPKVDNSHGD